MWRDNAIVCQQQAARWWLFFFKDVESRPCYLPRLEVSQ